MSKRLSVFAFIFLFFVLAPVVIPREPEQKNIIPESSYSLTRINANNLGMWVSNQGSYAWNLNTGDAGLEYPLGSGKTVVFAAGIWLGAFDADSERVAGADYFFEFAPGTILPGGSPDDPNDPRFRVYKITSASGPGDTDWDEWPAADGAPVDASGDPALLGEQTLWTVYNDADPALHTRYISKPFGVEIQHLVYAYSEAPPTALNNTIFQRFTAIHKGTDSFDTTYYSIWVDPDVGSFFEDGVGYDVERNMGYAYNLRTTDDIYGAEVPAVGFDALAASVGGTPVGVNAFSMAYGGQGPYWRDDRSAARRIVMSALVGAIFPYVWLPQYVPGTDDVSRYLFTGDPVGSSGWLDTRPHEKRMMLSVGPFAFGPGDTLTIDLAIIVGDSANMVLSVEDLRDKDDVVQQFYDDFLTSAVPEPQPISIGREYRLEQNYPNPFNPATRIHFEIMADSRVDIAIYNIRGQRVRTLMSKTLSQGTHNVTWDGRNDTGNLLASGIYYYRLKAGDYVETRKMLLLK